MPLDTLICGLCEETFTDLNDFVLHKQAGCATQHQQQQQQQQRPMKEISEDGSLSLSQADPASMSHDSKVIHMEMNEVGQISKMTMTHCEGDTDENTRADNGDLAFLDDVHNMEAELGLDRPGTDVDNDASTRTYVILKDAVDLDGEVVGAQDQDTKMESAFAHLEGTELEVLSTSQLMGSSVMDGSGTTTVIVSQEEFEAILQKQQQQQQSGNQVIKEEITTEPLAKKRCVGRAKKGEGKNQILEAVPPSTPRPTAPETNADGKLVCPQCKRTFTKERHFNTHKCLASSSYVDISKRDVVKIDSGDEEEEVGLYLEVDDGAHDDEQDEFSAPMEESMQVEKEDEEDDNEMDKDENVDVGDDDDNEDGTGSRKRKGRKRGRPSRSKTIVDSGPVEGGNANKMKQAVEAMENLPIFKNEEDKVAFEACIDVDLSQVDHMFRVHVIEQELNDLSGMVYNTPTVSSLSVYSCTVCEKVFKSLSHIRLHCITHTDLKPFKCNKCEYTTNSKGNLYTHMRKHTGQYYRCDQCDFKSVNKSHLVEHQMTHDSRRPTCMLCNKDYSTIKSMINHIRKYHTNKAGKEYLATFLSGRGQKGNTIIHQCHICNRKFKKRIDRDRHLFIHDIKDLPNVQLCMLCDYWASRKVYLDKHYLKHRVIYCCAVCNLKFLSIARLSEHLNTEHCSSEDSGMLMSDVLLQECVNRSYYLPEPVATTVEGSKYINLPTVLTDMTQDGSQQQGTDNGEGVALSRTQADEQGQGNVEGAVSHDLCSSDSIKEISMDLPETNPDLVDNPASRDDACGGVNNDMSSTSTPDVVFPFPTEYRDLIHESESNLKTGEDIIMMPHEVSPDVSLTENTEGITDFTKKELFQLEDAAVDPQDKESDTKGDGGVDSESSLAPEIKEGDPQFTDLNAEEKLQEKAAEESSTSTLLMLQNPGSDTEDKDDEENLKGEIVTEDEEENATELIDDAGSKDIGEGGNEELDQDNLGQEGNVVEKEEKEQEDIQEAETATDIKSRTKEDQIQSLIKKMGYRKMTFEIFNKMRETFGTEECEFCGRLFYNKMDHETHIRTHTGDKPFACSHCSFRSTTRDGLRRHSEKEHEKIAYQCKECDFLAPTRTRLWNHQLKHLGITGLSCSQCPEKFDSMKQLRAHLINTHQDMDKEAMEKLTGYTRRPQGKMGRRSFKCPHCPRVFIRANSELQKHIWIHEGIKPFACPICPYACRSKNNLQAHMLRHSAEKPFSCSECGKEYKSKTALRWHVRSHKSGKLFKCDKCPYEATQSSHLKRHMEIHDVLKRFVCKHCKFSANTLGYMKIHYAKHHKGLPFIHEESSQHKDNVPTKGVFKCLSCGYLFGNLSDLKRHLKVRHHIQMQDIAGMDQMQISEVEVVQYDEAAVASSQTLTDVQQVLQPTQISTDFQTRPPEEGGMPASTANLLQQIFGIGQGDSQVRVVSEDGQPLDISQDTIILQQDGQLLMTNDVQGGMLPGNQYIIQYFNPGEVSQENSAMGDNSTTSIQPIPSVPTSNQIQLIQTAEGQQQPTQFIITSADIGQTTQGSPSEHSILQTNQSDLNNQLVMASPDVQTQLVSIDGQTQILTTSGNDGNGNQLISMDHTNQQLLSVEGEETHYVTSDVERYGTQLIISDSGVGEVTGEQESVNLVCEDAEVSLEGH